MGEAANLLRFPERHTRDREDGLTLRQHRIVFQGALENEEDALGGFEKVKVNLRAGNKPELLLLGTDADHTTAVLRWPLVKALSLEVLGTVIAILAIVAAVDYLFQYRTWYQRQKMSLREMKDEFKQSEGDPAIKAKIRQLRHMRMKKRMMAAVPQASVIITNPTHYAVALQYDRGMNAPLCLAKGVDNIALKIREVAAEHNIPVVENPPLARALHATVEMDQEVPPEHYRAVAEVIGYVMRLQSAVRH